MNWMRAVAAVVVCGSLLSGTASAGPILWNFSSTGAQTETSRGVYSFTGVPSTMMESEPGAVLSLSLTELIGDYSVPALVSPIPVEGPTLTTVLTINDLASGQSGSLDVPIVFFDNEPVP